LVFSNFKKQIKRLRKKRKGNSPMTGKIYSILDRREVLDVLFYPRKETASQMPEADNVSVRVGVGKGVAVGGKIFVASPDAPVVLYFHGNGEIAADYHSIAPLYQQFGITLFVVDFRGYGTSDGAPGATALIDDAWTCFEQAPSILAEHGVQTEQLYVMGRSLGSAAALEIGSRATAGLAGLIIESGFAYTFALIERIGFLQIPDAYEAKDGFGNLEKIAAIDVPLLLIHGERDWIIPIADAEALYEASSAKQKSFVRVPGAGHNDLMLIGQQDYFAAIAKFCGVATVA